MGIPSDQISRLVEEFADQALFLFVLDAREELCAETRDCLGLIERQLIVDFATLKVAGHAT